jgi:hypothetical protein
VLPADGAGQPLTVPEGDPGDVLRSSTGQLTWQRDGLVTISTPRTQAVVGFTHGRPVDLSDVSIAIENGFAQVVVTSLSEQPIASAPRLLLTASARAENSGQTYRPMRMGLAELGSTPIWIEPVRARVVLRRAGVTAPRVFAVDWHGRRTPVTLPVEKDASAADTWAVRLGSQPCCWFEVQWD